VTLLVCVALLFVVSEFGCRDHPLPKQMHWFDLIAAQHLTVSKKARTRGHINSAGDSRRQQARKATR
jgi:hypothetical protein